MARRVFYSFHYVPDSWRTAMVRNIGVVEGNKPTRDNGWETVANATDLAIKRWISAQMNGRSCTVVLVGENTANRKWINHEIIKSWNDDMGVVGIRIHGLKNASKNIANIGANPFDKITIGSTSDKLSKVVKCYNPQGSNSNDRYAWIEANLQNAVEEAIAIRKRNP